MILGAGAQILSRSFAPEPFQMPAAPTPVGSFNITQLGDKADKVGKDTNFRGLTVFDNVVYYTKGSGGNGVGTGFPFGIWFASPDTLYVADEGDGVNNFDTATGQYTDAAAQTAAGLQKWVFNNVTGSWQLAYTLRSGLNLGQPYAVPGYPTGDQPGDGPAEVAGYRRAAEHHGHCQPQRHRDDLGHHLDRERQRRPGRRSEQARRDHRSSRRHGSGAETFRTVRTAQSGEVLRGVSFTPGGDRDHR